MAATKNEKKRRGSCIVQMQHRTVVILLIIVAVVIGLLFSCGVAAAVFFTRSSSSSSSSGSGNNGGSLGSGSGSGNGNGAVAASSSSVAAVSASVPAATGSFGSKFFAPYLETDMAQTYALAGGPAKFYTLAFVIADGSGQPSFNGTQGLAPAGLAAAITALRAKGGDVGISFGGESGSELATVATSVASLQAAYQSVVTAYKLRWADFDIEGGETEGASVDLRNKAIVGLQKANPNLMVSFTLSADTSGVNPPSVALLQNAKGNGVRIDLVTAMMMDYKGVNAASVIAGVQATRAQLIQLGLSSTGVGICPMIGQNDTSGETFSLSDAATVTAWAKSTSWVKLMTFWSIARDNGGCAGSTYAQPTCSGVSQQTYAYCAACQI